MYEPLAEYFARRGMVVLREVSTAHGRADILAVRVDWAACERRLAYGLTEPVLEPQLVRVLAGLPQRLELVDLARVAARFAIQPATLKKQLRRLEELGAVRQRQGAVEKPPLPCIVEQLVCCEAKLANWQAVVRQAYRHRFYAHRSFIALAHLPRTLDPSVLDRRGLGLMSVASGGTVRRERSAPMLEPSDSIAILQLQERVWREIVTNGAARIMAASLATAQGWDLREP